MGQLYRIANNGNGRVIVIIIINNILIYIKCERSQMFRDRSW